MFFKKKKTADRTKEDRELIEFNEKSVESLIVLAKGNDELVKQLKAMQEKIKYLIASDKAKVCDYDKTIGNKIGDLRIALTKSEGAENSKIEQLFSEIEIAVTDRNARL